MKIWIVSSLDKEIIQGDETIQGRKLYEEIRYLESFEQRVTYFLYFNFYKHIFGFHSENISNHIKKTAIYKKSVTEKKTCKQRVQRSKSLYSNVFLVNTL